MIKKVKAIFILLLSTSVLSLSFIDKDRRMEGLNIGDKAPYFSWSDDGGEMNLRQMEGKYVLISFWSSYDAVSRLNNANFSHIIRNNNKLEMVSISFDEYESVYKETIKKDQIASDNCFVGRFDNQSKLFKTYKIAKGFRNYLLDEQGNIVAKDVTPSQLSSYCN